MNTGRSIGRVATQSSFVPVLLPLFFLCAIASTAKMVQQVQNPHQESHGKVTINEANPTETTFLGYKRVEELSSGNEAGALALLQTLVEAPLSVRGNTFRSRELASFSPQAILMTMIQSLVSRAFVAAERGDTQTAYIYRESLLKIGDRLLHDSTPSVMGIQTAYRFHTAAARIDARLHSGESLSVARYEESMLRDVWRTQFAPRLDRYTPSGDTQDEARFAEQITREYREACSRIRAGEV